MSVEGLHAWIAEVERKLAKRTRVFLALTVIAIGIAGAAVYLAIDARESSVSESDVQALQEKLEARIDEFAATGSTPPVEAEAESKPAPAPSEQKPNSGGEKQGKSGAGTSGGGSGGGSDGGSGSAPGGTSGDAAGSAKLRELLEQTKRRAEEAE